MLDTRGEALRTTLNAASGMGLDPSLRPSDLRAAQAIVLLSGAATCAEAQTMEVVELCARLGRVCDVHDTNELRPQWRKPIEHLGAALPTGRNVLARRRRRWADWLRSCHGRVPRNQRCRSSGGCAG